MCIKKGFYFPFIVMIVLLIFTLACEQLNIASSSLPTVRILEPVSGSTVPVNTDLTIQVSASDADGAGITRIDLLVDDVVVDSYDSPTPQNDIAVNLHFVPTEEKAISVAVTAFREDGKSSLPATVALSVVGASVEAQAESSEPTEESASEDSDSNSDSAGSDEEAESAITVEARANTSVAIREAPGPGCPIIGEVPEGEVIEFLIKTNDETEYWYQTNYLGENNLGWVYHDFFTLLEDDSILPLVPQVGCLFCGDAVCSPEINEACNTCEADCGPCCGNGTCEAQFGEDCATCEADCGPCCGNSTCEAARGEDCATCEVDCGSCCGNDACDHGETCETCETDCGVCPAVCGNGEIEPGEACDPPNAICYDSEGYAGDCSSDCSACTGPG